MNESYINFLKSKIEVAPVSGFDIEADEVNPALKSHQRDAVIWAIKGGRRALFESFGLGKTAQQLEYCRIVTEHEGGKALIVCPLGVKQEFKHDAVNLLGWDAAPEYVTNMEEAKNAQTSIVITNYERVRDGDIDPKEFVATSLDEASVLRSFGSKTYQTFLDKFKGVKYKLVSTATPSPNKYKELIHYAGYLEKNIGLTWDIGHCEAAGNIDEKFMLKNTENLYHMHVHDAFEKKDHLPLGKGRVNLHERLKTAEKAGCRCVVEVKTSDALCDSVHWLKENKYMK